MNSFQKAIAIPIKPTKIIIYPTSLPWFILSIKLGVCIKLANKLPPTGPVGSTPNFITSPGSALESFFAELTYLPSGCLPKKAYCPLLLIYSRYLPSQIELYKPTLITLQLTDSPSRVITLALKETTSEPATISLCSSYQRPSNSLIVGNSVALDILDERLFKNVSRSLPY